MVIIKRQRYVSYANQIRQLFTDISLSDIRVVMHVSDGFFGFDEGHGACGHSLMFEDL
jgi:hypothetical protein